MNKRLGVAIGIVASGIIIAFFGVLAHYFWTFLGCDIGGSSPGECTSVVVFPMLFGGAFTAIAVFGVYIWLRKRNHPIT